MKIKVFRFGGRDSWELTVFRLGGGGGSWELLVFKVLGNYMTFANSQIDPKCHYEFSGGVKEF